MSKLTSVGALHDLLEAEEVTVPIPNRESLSIDNTNVSPEDAAMRIVAHYGLPISSE